MYDKKELKTRKVLIKDEAAFYIGIHRNTFTKIMNSDGFYPLVKIGHNGSRVFINREKLDQWIDEQNGSVKKLK